MSEPNEALSQGSDLRLRRRRRMARDIERAALNLFAEAGYDNVTVEQIAEAADISKRTFFRYFAGKEAVLHGNSERRTERFRDALTDRPREEPLREALRRAFLVLAESYEEDRDVVLLRVRSYERTPEVFTAAAFNTLESMEWITDWVADRMGADATVDLRPRVMAWTFLTAFQAALRTWFARGAEEHLPMLVSEAFEIQEQIASHSTG